MSKPRILRLLVDKENFDVMVTGEKQVEYRNKTRWIESRIWNKNGTERLYDFVEFTNGYGLGRPSFTARYLFCQPMRSVDKTFSNGLEVKCGPCYAIGLGEIVKIENHLIPSPTPPQ